MTTQTLDTRVGRLAYEDFGEGPPVLLWHSLLVTREMWRAQADDLARDHRVILLDGPAHGESGPPPGPFTLEDCVLAAVEILDARSIDRAAWVGLSWGGMVAMRAALLVPHRVSALGLFDTSADAEPWPFRLRDQALTSVYRAFGFQDFLADRVRALMYGATTLERDPDVGGHLRDHLRRADRQGMVRAIEAVVIDRRSVLDDLHRVPHPALVAVGTEDVATPPEFARRLAEALPHARLETIPEAGHLSALEAPDAVTRLLRRFLAECESS